jgi:hypothetical protein
MAYWMVACSVYLYIAVLGANVRFCRDEGRPDHDRSPGNPPYGVDPVIRALVGRAGRFDAVHTLSADRCRVRSVRRED